MADDVTPLASLSVTHVYYNPDDPLSYLCAFLALVPQALCVAYATLLWATREAEVLLLFAGQLACEAVNFALKRLIKEERPQLRRTSASSSSSSTPKQAEDAVVMVGKGYGMPSSHAQFVVFWAVALALFLLVRHRPAGAARRQLRRRRQQQQLGGEAARGQEGRVGGGGGGGKGKKQGGPAAGIGDCNQEEDGEGTPSSSSPCLADVPRAYRAGGLPALSASIEAYSHGPWTLAERALVSAGALLVAGLVAWSRVYLGYHTVRQVLAGCAAGAVSAVAWFAVTYLLRETGMLAWALELPLARWFRVRDLVVEEDLCQAGWEKWEARRRAALEAARERERAKERKAE